MALEQRSLGAKRLHLTGAARALDPTGKGAVSYFLGLAVCKLFAAKMLDAPWMLHFDLFRRTLGAELSGRSRPDLVGQTTKGEWVVFECKGRLSVPSTDAKTKAKQQARRLIRIGGQTPKCQVGGIAYFQGDALRFFWQDPEPPEEEGSPIIASVRAHYWQHYYSPVLDAIRSNPPLFDQMQQQPVRLSLEEADIEVGILPEVLRALVDSRWEEARELADRSQVAVDVAQYQPDGIAVVAGPSWSERLGEGSLGG